MFNTRHYIAIAEVLKSTRPQKGVQLTLWKFVVDELDKVFRADNGKFSSDKFINACNYYGEN